MTIQPRSLACWLLLIFSSWTVALGGKSKDHLVVVVLSGLQDGSLSAEQTPNLFRAAEEGASASVRSFFPTESFPNQYSLVTGLSPAAHGVLWNRMVNVESEDEVVIDSSTGDAVLLSGEPLWATAKKEHIRTASFTTGTMRTNEFLNKPCTLCKPETILVHLLAWVSSSIKSNASAPTLSLVAMPALSASRHDEIVGKLLEDMHEQQLDQLVNVVITGDYGLVSEKQRDIVCLPELLAGTSYDVIDYSGGAVSLRPTGNNETVSSLMNHLKTDKRITSLGSYDFAHQYSHGHSRRVAPVTVLAKDDSVVILDTACDLQQELTSDEALLHRSGYRSKDALTTKAVGIGPRFAKGASIRSANITDLHGLMCAVLRLQSGACSNASPRSVQGMLTSDAVIELDGGDRHVADEANMAPHVSTHREVTGFGVFVIILCGVVFVGGIFWMKNYFTERRRKSGGSYHLVQNGFDPDLSMRTEPLLGSVDNCDSFTGDSLQLSVLGDKSHSHMISSDDDDAPSTYTI